MGTGSSIVTPKFLPEQIVKTVVDMVLDGFMHTHRMDEVLRHKMCHIVIMVPAFVGVSRLYDFHVLYERSVGDKEKWPKPYDQIARSKAEQLAHSRNEDGDTDSMKHLLMPGDTVFWGGVKRHGVVVACSGVQPYFDQMFSGMIADGLKAFGRHHFEQSPEAETELPFIT